MTDLVERVASIYEAKWQVSDYYSARAAIRLVLEEAAKVAEMYPAAMIGGPDAYCRGHIAACTQTAAAIRSMMPEVK